MEQSNRLLSLVLLLRSLTQMLEVTYHITTSYQPTKSHAHNNILGDDDADKLAQKELYGQHNNDCPIPPHWSRISLLACMPPNSHST